MSDVAGILLAGGRSRRMGQDKALLSLPGKSPETFLQRLTAVVLTICAEVVLVARDQQQSELYAPLLPSSVRIVIDQVPDRGPLMGLFSGLSVIRSPYALVTAVDTPLLQPALLSYLLSLPRDDSSLIVPLIEDIPQVLCALYPRAIRATLECLLEEGRRDVRAVLQTQSGSVQFVSEAQIRTVDPQLLSFINVNTPTDLDMLQHSVCSGFDQDSI